MAKYKVKKPKDDKEAAKLQKDIYDNTGHWIGRKFHFEKGKATTEQVILKLKTGTYADPEEVKGDFKDKVIKQIDKLTDDVEWDKE